MLYIKLWNFKNDCKLVNKRSKFENTRLQIFSFLVSFFIQKYEMDLSKGKKKKLKTIFIKLKTTKRCDHNLSVTSLDLFHDELILRVYYLFWVFFLERRVRLDRLWSLDSFYLIGFVERLLRSGPSAFIQILSLSPVLDCGRKRGFGRAVPSDLPWISAPFLTRSS